MSDVFATATVEITPKLTGFVKDLDALLKEKMKLVKPPVIRVKPGLTPDFVGNLRKQVNAAIVQAQKGIKPIRIAAVVTTPTGKPAGGGVLPVAGGGGTAAATRAPAEKIISEAAQLSIAQKAVASTTERLTGLETKLLTTTAGVSRERLKLNELIRAGETVEKGAASAANTTDAALQKQLAALKTDIEAKIKDQAETVRLAEANKLLATSAAGTASTAGEKAALRARQKTFSEVRLSARGLRDASVASEKLGKDTRNLAGANEILTTRQVAVRDATKAVSAAEAAGIEKHRTFTQNLLNTARQSVKDSEQQIASIRKLNTEESKRARSSEQLTRGGQASILSLAGIRGATLAASRSFLVGAAAITVFAKAVKQFADLNRNLDVFQATASATADQMQRVRDAAIKLGADLTLPSVSAGDAAGAMVELAKAGLSVEDSIAGARGVLELATAAAIDNAAATQLVANALNAFGLEGKDAIVVADTFANAANAAQGSIADIGTAFQQAASAGRQVGLSFSDTSVFLTQLAKNGLRGADAGTSLRTALIRLVNPSKAAAEQFKKLGIVVRDAAGDVRPDVFIQIAEATKKLTPAQRDATVALIGGQDAFRAVTILGRQTIQQFIGMRKALREEGSAAELAAARTKGLHGAVDGLQSVLETVGTSIGGSVGPALANFTRGVSASITSLSESKDLTEALQGSLQALGSTITGVANVVAAASPLFLGLGKNLLAVTNSIGPGNILAGVVAFKALGKVLNPNEFDKTKSAIATFSKVIGGIGAEVSTGTSAMNKASIATRSLGLALSSLVSPQTALLVGAAALAGAFFFMATSETAAERATRHLSESTNALADSITRAKTAAREQAIATHSVNAAQLGVLEAQQAVGSARAALANTNAAKGTTARRVLELQLAVALDNVAIAQQRYNDAVAEGKAASDVDREAAKLRAKGIRDTRDSILDTISTQKREVDLFGRRGRGESGAAFDLRKEATERQNIINKLHEQAKANRETLDSEKISGAKRLDLLAKFIQLTKTTPTSTQIFQVLRAENIKEAAKALEDGFKAAGLPSALAFVQALLAGIKPVGPEVAPKLVGGLAALLRDRGFEGGQSLGDGIAAGIASKAAAIAAALAAAVKAGSRASRREDLLAGAGASDAALAAAAQDRLDAARRAVTAAQKQVTLKPGDEDAQQALTDAAAERRSAFEAVQQLQDQQVTDAKDAQQKRDAAGQKIIDAITEGRKASLLQRKITSAGLTDWLGDDLKTSTAWLNFLKQQKKTLVARLRAVGASKAVISAALKAIGDLIFSTRNDIERTTKEIEANTKQRQADRFAKILERADLGVALAEAHVTDANKNIPALLRAHRIRLEAIRKELARVREQHGKNSLEWLRLKVTEQEEIQSINALKDTTADRNNALSKLAFEFLQAQQGFTASLLGNLFPTNPVGLSGGTPGIPVGPPPGKPRQGSSGGNEQPRGPGANLARAQATSGAQGSTAGQMSMLIAVNQKMLSVLQVLAGHTSHPGANNQRAANRDKSRAAAGIGT